LLSDFFSGAGGAQVKSLECRSDMCRVEATFDSEKSRSAFLDHLGQPPFDKGTFGTLDPDMKGLVVFTGREGRPLPTFSADDG
jgi:hypothetical protein